MKVVRSTLVLGLSTLLIFGVAYPLLMIGAGQLVPHAASGLPIYRGDSLVGYKNIGQEFRSRRYFHGRPSAVGYNGIATGGSNFGSLNPAFLSEIEARVQNLLEENPTLKREDIPVELVTASASGLDPHISVKGALLQVARVAQSRNLPEAEVRRLVTEQTEGLLLGILGPGDRLNVLTLNLALDNLQVQTVEQKDLK